MNLNLSFAIHPDWLDRPEDLCRSLAEAARLTLPPPAGDRRDPGPPRDRPARPPARNGNGHGPDRPARESRRVDGPPRNARHFLGWLSKHEDRRDDVKALVRSWELPSRILDWEDADVTAVYNELNKQPAGRSEWGG
jgi:hypothetical protein